MNIAVAIIIGACIVGAAWSIWADKQAEKIEENKIKAYFRGYEDGKNQRDPNYPHP